MFDDTKVYLLILQGTPSSKRKKEAKLKRVMATVKKQERREKASATPNFAAIQLLHDPQVRHSHGIIRESEDTEARIMVPVASLF